LLRVPLHPLESGAVTLPDAAARYVSRVHRLGAGDRFVLFDPELRVEADAVVESSGRTVECHVGALRESAAVARSGITLLQGLGKGDKPDQVIRDATALGVDRIVLVETERAVVHVPDERHEVRRARWRAIAVEAARQSGRGDVPIVEGPLPFEDALTQGAQDTRRLFLSPDATTGLAVALRDLRRAEPLLLLIGPEGGFAAGESAVALERGFVPVSLGRFVLRTETAAVAVLGAIVAFAAEARG
jgi:16S rRNA (uracil1498-N3)-methyltransferase